MLRRGSEPQGNVGSRAESMFYRESQPIKPDPEEVGSHHLKKVLNWIVENVLAFKTF
jgi:hypothetical protein